MSSDSRPPVSRLEIVLLLTAMVLAMVWYAVPQALFSLYPLAELLRALFP